MGLRMNWKTHFLWLMFTLIPMTGAWHYTQAYQNENQIHQVMLSRLRQETGLQRSFQYQINEFHLRDVEPVTIEGYEYALIDSSGKMGECFDAVLLRRSIDLKGSLSERMNSGTVQGAVTGDYFSFDKSIQIGLNVSCSDPDRFLIFDVDGKGKSQLASILWATIGLSIYGLVFVLYLNSKIEGSEFRDLQRRNRVQSQVALQLFIARHDSYKHY